MSVNTIWRAMASSLLVIIGLGTFIQVGSMPGGLIGIAPPLFAIFGAAALWIAPGAAAILLVTGAAVSMEQLLLGHGVRGASFPAVWWVSAWIVIAVTTALIGRRSRKRLREPVLGAVLALSLEGALLLFAGQFLLPALAVGALACVSSAVLLGLSQRTT